MSLYNDYRPMGYGEVIGQEGIIASLKNMVAEKRVSSTILFYGPRGTGKTTVARIFAKALNCLSPKEPGVPCGECESCKDVANGDSLNVIEIDAACFQRDIRVRLANGKTERIGTIVDKRLPLIVPSYNFELHRIENKPIINWYKNGSSDQFYNIYLDSGCGEKRCISGVTLNHKVFDKDEIKRPLNTFNIGDEILFEVPNYNDIQLSILAGTLLGDSSLTGGYKSNKGIYSKNVQLQFSHNIKNQYDYFYYKALLLNSIGDYSIKENVKSGFGGLFNNYKSKTNEYLTKIKEEWYNGNLKKNITDNWLSHVNEISLAFWYMDDGTHSDSDKNKSSLRLYTNGFKETEVDKLIDFLNKKWQLNAYKSEDRRRKQYYISIGREGGDKFFGLIVKYIHPSMKYKLPIKFRDIVFDDTIYNYINGGTNLIPVKIKDIKPFRKGNCKSFVRYDIEVADNHNYFIGRGVLVSNSHTGVDNMRELKTSSSLVGAGGGWKVYIIDECHMLSKAAQNSALKMLEESPDKTVFILATTELHKVEGTIVSRSLMFDFRPVTIDIVAERLSFICNQEGFEFEEAALVMIAKIAHGGVRDSISILERVALENGKKVLVSGIVRSLGITPTEVLMKLGNVLKGDYKSSIEIADSVVNGGNDIFQFFNSAIDYYRGVLMLKLGMNHLVKVESQMLANMDEVSGSVSQEQISKAISILEEGIGKYKYTEDKQILLEITLYKIADGLKSKVSSVNEVKVPMQIDEGKISAMMQEQFQKLMASANLGSMVASKPVEVVQQVQQNRNVQQDTVNSVQQGQSCGVKTDDIAGKMLAYLKQNWPQFLNILKGNNLGTVSTTIEMAEPVSFENNTLRLKFKSGDKFFADMFNSMMVPDTSMILSKCMNVRCGVVAFSEIEENRSDTVNNDIQGQVLENKKQVEMLKFSPDAVVEQPVQVQDSFEVKNTAGDTFMVSQPAPEYQPVAEQTQSFLGQPEPVVKEEPKMTKDDPVDMKMLDMMFQ